MGGVSSTAGKKRARDSREMFSRWQFEYFLIISSQKIGTIKSTASTPFFGLFSSINTFYPYKSQEAHKLSTGRLFFGCNFGLFVSGGCLGLWRDMFYNLLIFMSIIFFVEGGFRARRVWISCQKWSNLATLFGRARPKILRLI